VEEPGVVATTYSYNGLNQLVEVSMPRGVATQVRSFSYAGGFLVSATHPENGAT
jgi:YD repeat-containing protein